MNFDYTGAAQTFTPLLKGSYKLDVWGAQGGYRSNATYAGKGGYSYGTINLDLNTNMFIYVGGNPNAEDKTCTSSICPGGFNGGGKRHTYKGGGGASDIRIGTDSLYARVIVAGGGGSDRATSKEGGAGGGGWYGNISGWFG